MKKLKFILLTLMTAIYLSLSLNAGASTPLTGNISELWVNDGSSTNIGYISIGSTYSTSCSGGASRYLIFDFTEPGMKEAYAMALAAFMAGKKITMAGAGVCYGTSEKLKYINLITTNQ